MDEAAAQPPTAGPTTRRADSLLRWTHAIILVGCWFVYRILRGWLALRDRRPIYR